LGETTPILLLIDRSNVLLLGLYTGCGRFVLGVGIENNLRVIFSWKFFTDAGGMGDVQTFHGNDFSVAKKMGKHLVLFAVGTPDD
jgi:hypothetical protein